MGAKGKQHGSDDPDAGKKDGDNAEAGDDDDDIFDCVSLATSLRTEMYQQKTKPVATCVHYKVCIPLKNNKKWLIVFDNPRETYYSRPDHTINQVRNYQRKKFLGKTILDWVDTISRLSIQAEEHGQQNVYWRAKNGKTRGAILLSITLPTSKEIRFETILKQAVALIFLMFKKRKLNPAGVLALDYIYINSPKGTTKQQQGLYGHLLETINGDVKVMTKHMLKELSNYHKDGQAFSYDKHFDKYLVYWDIKCIVEE